MHIEVNTHDISHGEGLDDYVRNEVEKALRKFEDHLTRIEVYLSDENGPKGGADKNCRMEARPRGLDPLVVKHVGHDTKAVVHETAEKLEHALRHQLGKTGRKPSIS